MVLPPFAECFGFRAEAPDGTRFTDRDSFVNYLHEKFPEDVSLMPAPPYTRSLNEAKLFFYSDRQEYIIFFTRTRLWCYTKVAKFLGFVERWTDEDAWLFDPVSDTTMRLGPTNGNWFETPPPPMH